MIQFRRLAAVLMGAWLGASILTDVAVSQNFQTVDRFLQSPGSVSTSLALKSLGREQARFILRRNAGEENNWIFMNWERVELALGSTLFFLLLLGERPHKSLLALSLLMFGIVIVEHFLLTPEIVYLGRHVDDLPASDPLAKRFWTLHGLYAGFDILKIVLGLAFGARILIRRKPDKERFVREFAVSTPAEGRQRG